MNENAAAIKIQQWYRAVYVRQLLVKKVRKSFEEICVEIGDKVPLYNNSAFCYPDFDMPDDVQCNFIQGSIANRIGILKYQDTLSPK